MSLFGNPIEQIPGYRMWILGALYSQSDSLKKFDCVVVTRKEFANVCVWNERFQSKNAQKLKKVSDTHFKTCARIRMPPAEKKEEDPIASAIAE